MINDVKPSFHIIVTIDWITVNDSSDSDHMDHFDHWWIAGIQKGSIQAIQIVVIVESFVHVSIRSL